MPKIGGVLSLKADGVQFSVGGTMSISINSWTREAVVGATGVAGYKETAHAPRIEFQAIADPSLDIDAIQKVTDATVQVELSGGRKAVLRNAWTAGDVTLDAIEGTVDMAFEGLSGDWVS